MTNATLAASQVLFQRGSRASDPSSEQIPIGPRGLFPSERGRLFQQERWALFRPQERRRIVARRRMNGPVLVVSVSPPPTAFGTFGHFQKAVPKHGADFR